MIVGPNRQVMLLCLMFCNFDQGSMLELASDQDVFKWLLCDTDFVFQEGKLYLHTCISFVYVLHHLIRLTRALKCMASFF